MKRIYIISSLIVGWPLINPEAAKATSLLTYEPADSPAIEAQPLISYESPSKSIMGIIDKPMVTIIDYINNLEEGISFPVQETSIMVDGQKMIEGRTTLKEQPYPHQYKPLGLWDNDNVLKKAQQFCQVYIEIENSRLVIAENYLSPEPHSYKLVSKSQTRGEEYYNGEEDANNYLTPVFEEYCWERPDQTSWSEKVLKYNVKRPRELHWKEATSVQQSLLSSYVKKTKDTSLTHQSDDYLIENVYRQAKFEETATCKDLSNNRILKTHATKLVLNGEDVASYVRKETITYKLEYGKDHTTATHEMQTIIDGEKINLVTYELSHQNTYKLTGAFMFGYEYKKAWPQSEVSIITGDGLRIVSKGTTAPNTKAIDYIPHKGSEIKGVKTLNETGKYYLTPITQEQWWVRPDGQIIDKQQVHIRVDKQPAPTTVTAVRYEPLYKGCNASYLVRETKSLLGDDVVDTKSQIDYSARFDHQYEPTGEIKYDDAAKKAWPLSKVFIITKEDTKVIIDAENGIDPKAQPTAYSYSDSAEITGPEVLNAAGTHYETPTYMNRTWLRPNGDAVATIERILLRSNFRFAGTVTYKERERGSCL